MVPAATACQTTLPWSQIPNWSVPLQTTAPSVRHVAILAEAIGNAAPKAVPIDCGDVTVAVIDGEALKATSVVTVYADTGTAALEALGLLIKDCSRLGTSSHRSGTACCSYAFN